MNDLLLYGEEKALQNKGMALNLKKANNNDFPSR